ncbi:MAG: hypothetical protein JXR78_00150 [Victivallales bacterium]|nr:hypothetical protein [Victivallales bacterium]
MRIKTYFEEDNTFHRLHTYFKGSPYDNTGRYILYVKFKGAPDGQVCLLDKTTEMEEVIGQCSCVDYHNAAWQYFCDSTRKVIYHQDTHTVGIYDIESKITSTIKLNGIMSNYSGVLDQHFIEIDDDFPLKEQYGMGIYLHAIDGKSKKTITNIEKLLSLHPQGGNIRNSNVLLRLGAEISPDQKKLILFLVSRNGTLVRDYFLCDIDGDNIEFVGRLGCHIMWCPNSKDIISSIAPWMTDLGSLSNYKLDESKHASGLLAMYNIDTKILRVLSEHPIGGGSHQSSSPDGKRIVIDTCNKPDQSIYLFNMDSNEMSEIYRFDKVPLRDDPVLSRSSLRNHAHPAFSRDGKFILINRCTNGVTKICEIELEQ